MNDLHDTAAALSATAADIAASIAEGRACPDLLDHARDMLYTLTDELGDTPDPVPPPRPRRWLPARVLAYARARHALDANDINEYESGVCWDTVEFLRLNRAVAGAETGVPVWVQAVVDRLIERRMHYWDRIPAHAAAASDACDRPLPVVLTPKALAVLAEDTR